MTESQVYETLYKLTDANYQTRAGYPNQCTWGDGVTHTAVGAGTALCGPDVIHAYRHPLIAVLLNLVHADIKVPRLWEAVGLVVAEALDKVGVKALTTIRQIPLPAITVEQRVRFAIACALSVYKDTSFRVWAAVWLSGGNRSRAAPARAAAGVASAAYAADAASAAARAAAYAATDAAASAAAAAHAAAYAAAAYTAALTPQKLLDITLWAVTEAGVEVLDSILRGDNDVQVS